MKDIKLNPDSVFSLILKLSSRHSLSSIVICQDMSQTDVGELWLQTKGHVDDMLSQADSHEKMLYFVEAMNDHYKKCGCNEEESKELKILMGARCLHYALNLQSDNEKVLNEYKKAIFEPGKEECLIVSKKDMDRVVGMVDDRNGQLVPEDQKQRKTKRGRIKYRLVR
jgi:hypothetical protein